MKKIIAILFLTFSVLALTSCGTLSSRDNAVPIAPLTAFTPTIHTQQLWVTRAGSGTGSGYNQLTPAIYHGTVFTADYTGNVTAVNASNGNVLWKVNTHLPFTSGVSVNGGRLFIGTGHGTVAALNTANGQIFWNRDVGNQVFAKPAIAHGLVLVKSIDGVLTALSRNSGAVMWQFRQTVPSLVLHASSSAKVSGQTVVAGFANGKLAALQVKNGAVLWVNSIADPKGVTDVERMVDIDVTPVIVNGIVYVATYQGNIAALNLKTGELIWKHKISSYAGLTSDYSNIYLSDAMSHLWAFSEEVGAVQWWQKALSGRNITGPILVGNYVVVGDAEGYLHWISKNNGQFAARDHLDASGIVSLPIVSNGNVYIYTRSGNLFAYRVVK